MFDGAGRHTVIQALLQIAVEQAVDQAGREAIAGAQTIHNLDLVVVLENGRMVEQGRGPELVARGGVYAKLFASGNYPA